MNARKVIGIRIKDLFFVCKIRSAINVRKNAPRTPRLLILVSANLLFVTDTSKATKAKSVAVAPTGRKFWF